MKGPSRIAILVLTSCAYVSSVSARGSVRGPMLPYHPRESAATTRLPRSLQVDAFFGRTDQTVQEEEEVDNDNDENNKIFNENSNNNDNNNDNNDDKNKDNNNNDSNNDKKKRKKKKQKKQKKQKKMKKKRKRKKMKKNMGLNTRTEDEFKKKEKKRGKKEKKKKRKQLRKQLEACAEANNNDNLYGLDLFIIGGATTRPNQYPFFAQRYYFDNPAGCGGSLIAQNWVLTAAHCLDNGFTHQGNYPQWRVGSYCIVGDSAEENCGSRSTLAQSDRVVIHPQWDPKRISYDFGLSRLDRIVSEEPLRIDNGKAFSKLQEGDPVRSIGMGYINDQQELADYLQEVTNYFLPPVKCYPNAESIMCTNGRNVGTCRGDSGSPNLTFDATSKTKWTQVGITSFGRGGGCEGHDFPDGLARVSTVFDWIVDTVCNDYLGEVPEFCPEAPSPLKCPPTE